MEGAVDRDGAEGRRSHDSEGRSCQDSQIRSRSKQHDRCNHYPNTSILDSQSFLYPTFTSIPNPKSNVILTTADPVISPWMKKSTLFPGFCPVARSGCCTDSVHSLYLCFCSKPTLEFVPDWVKVNSSRFGHCRPWLREHRAGVPRR